MPRVTRYVQTLNKPQQNALVRVFKRTVIRGSDNEPISYRQFRKTVQFSFDCAMVPWCGMWLGIEQDGHTHS